MDNAQEPYIKLLIDQIYPLLGQHDPAPTRTILAAAGRSYTFNEIVLTIARVNYRYKDHDDPPLAGDMGAIFLHSLIEHTRATNGQQ